jgi:hypothetical protein
MTDDDAEVVEKLFAAVGMTLKVNELEPLTEGRQLQVTVIGPDPAEALLMQPAILFPLAINVTLPA